MNTPEIKALLAEAASELCEVPEALDCECKEIQAFEGPEARCLACSCSALAERIAEALDAEGGIS